MEKEENYKEGPGDEFFKSYYEAGQLLRESNYRNNEMDDVNQG